MHGTYRHLVVLFTLLLFSFLLHFHGRWDFLLRSIIFLILYAEMASVG